MMLGLVSLVTCAAPAIGPVFGGLVMEFLNWHWIFYAMIPFLVISFVLGAATVPDIRHGEKGYLSVPSLLLVAVGLAGIIVAASFFAQWNGDQRLNLRNRQGGWDACLLFLLHFGTNLLGLQNGSFKRFVDLYSELSGT